MRYILPIILAALVASSSLAVVFDRVAQVMEALPK